MQQYSLTVEREIFTKWLLRVGYSGSKATHLQRTQPLNFIQPGLFTLPTTLAQQQAEQAAGIFTAINSAATAAVDHSQQSNRSAV